MTEKYRSPEYEQSCCRNGFAMQAVRRQKGIGNRESYAAEPRSSHIRRMGSDCIVSILIS